LTTKGSKRWFKRVVSEWELYVGEHATLQEYTSGGAAYETRLQQDLKKWWGNHPDRSKRLTPEEINTLAHRLADYIQMYTSPITSPEITEQLRPQWIAFADNVVPEDALRGKRMFEPSSVSESEKDKDQDYDS
jgi:hypothetical protein